jgi:hypothetical protein
LVDGGTVEGGAVVDEPVVGGVDGGLAVVGGWLVPLVDGEDPVVVVALVPGACSPLAMPPRTPPSPASALPLPASPVPTFPAAAESGRVPAASG